MDLTADGPEPANNLDAFFAGGPKTFQQAFPPVCIKTDRDPTRMSQYILPFGAPTGPLALDPRQATRICTSYYTTSRGDAPIADTNDTDNPAVPAALLGFPRSTTDAVRATPPGGAAGRGAPYHLYADAVNLESSFRRLDAPLSRCKERKYVPEAVDDATNTLPHIARTYELDPHSLYVTKEVDCRSNDDEAAWNRSSRLFFNSTKLDRYTPTAKVGPLVCNK
jgi:hypothetical protein